MLLELIVGDPYPGAEVSDEDEPCSCSGFEVVSYDDVENIADVLEMIEDVVTGATEVL